MLAPEAAAQAAEDERRPEEQADHQQHLPEAAQVEVLEPLDAEDRAVLAKPAVDAAELADQAAEDDDRKCGQQAVGEPVLSLRLAPGDHRRQEDPGGEEGGRDEEDRELDVEGAGEVEGEQLGEVDAEEVPELRAIVLRGGADHRLDQEQSRHHQEEPGAGALRGRQRHLPGLSECQRRLLAAVPAEEVPASEGGEQQSDPAEQRDQRDDAPEDDVRGRPVIDEILGRPVVGVGVVVTRPAGRGGPGRPAEEGGQLVGLLGVVDRVRAQSLVGGRIGEVVAVVSFELGEGTRLGPGVRRACPPGVVAVRLEVGDRLLARAVGARAAVLAFNRERRPMKVVGGVVGAQVGAVAEDRPVLHQAVVEKDALPVADVVAGEDRLPGGVDDAIGDRRVGAVGAVCQQAEDEEPEQEDDDRRLNPDLGDQEFAPLGLLRHRDAILSVPSE